MEAAKCPRFSPLTPEVPATATTKGEVTFYLFISQLNFYKGIPDSSPRVKQKRLLGVGCTSARRPGLPRIAARPARARPPLLLPRRPLSFAPRRAPPAPSARAPTPRGASRSSCGGSQPGTPGAGTGCKPRVREAAGGAVCSPVRAARARTGSPARAKRLPAHSPQPPGPSARARDALARGRGRRRRGRSQPGGGAFTRAPVSFSCSPPPLSGLRPPLGVYLFTSGLRQLLPLFLASGPAPWPFSRPLRLRICLRHNGAISGLAGVSRHAPATHFLSAAL